MKLFEELYNTINDAFDTPYQWKLTQKPGLSDSNKPHVYTFQTDDGEEYTVTFVENQVKNCFDVTFENIKNPQGDYKDDSMGILGTGDAFKVFATVYDIFKTFIVHHQDVEVFCFSATAKSRQKLYNRFARGLADKYGFGLSVDDDGARRTYYLRR